MKKVYENMSVMDISKMSGVVYPVAWRHFNGKQRMTMEKAILYHVTCGIPMQFLLKFIIKEKKK